MKTTNKIILSLSLLFVPQIAFGNEFGYDTGDEMAALNASQVTNANNSSESWDTLEKVKLLLENAEKSAEEQAEWEAFLKDLGQQPATLRERFATKSKNAKLQIARFQKNHPNIVTGSAIAGGTLAAVGGAVAAYKKSSVVKTHVDKAALAVKDGAQKAAVTAHDAVRAAKDYIFKKAAVTRSVVDGEIETLDNTNFSRADAIVVAGGAVAAYGIYKAVPTIQATARKVGSWAKEKVSEASSSDAAINAQVNLQATANFIKNHPGSTIAAPVAALAVGYAAYRGYKAYKAKQVAQEVIVTEEVAPAAEDVN